MVNDGRPLAQVIAENVRRIRADKTMDQLATEGRSLGMNWSSGSIGAIEQGRFRPSLDVLAALADALGALHDPDSDTPAIPISELVQTDGTIQIGSRTVTTPDSLVEWLAGGPLSLYPSETEIDETRDKLVSYLERLKPLSSIKGFKVSDLRKLGATTPGEKRLAKKINVDPLELKAWSQRLWDMSIEEKRDEVAGEGSTPQKKGRVSRDLLEEITNAMNRDNGND